MMTEGRLARYSDWRKHGEKAEGLTYSSKSVQPQSERHSHGGYHWPLPTLGYLEDDSGVCREDCRQQTSERDAL